LEANRRRARVVKRLPKFSLAVHADPHLILAARATTGMGADHAHFVPLLRRARTRMSVAVASGDAQLAVCTAQGWLNTLSGIP